MEQSLNNFRIRSGTASRPAESVAIHQDLAAPANELVIRVCGAKPNTVYLAQPEGLGNKGKIVVEGQRPGRFQITRYLGHRLAHQTAGPLALSTITKPETQPFRLG